MLSLEEKIGQMLAIGFDGLKPPDYLLEWLAAGRVGGVILFARNVASPAQVAELISACREAAPRAILIAVDQEGGMVARLRAAEGFMESPGAMALGAAGSEALAERVAAAMGDELAALGINWNLAPVVDLALNRHNPSISTRALGDQADHVSQLAAAQVRGFQSAGVAATAKHFPGLGDTPVDTHEALAVINEPLKTLLRRDLLPFKAAVEAGVAAVMMTHTRFQTVDPEYPATLSPAVIGQILRGEIGFNGVACTDCMEMKAITENYGAGESAVLAALAGQDVIFFSHTPAYQEAAYEALLAAARGGRLPVERVDEAVSRLEAMKARFPARPPETHNLRRRDHLILMDWAARAGTVLLRGDPDLLPLKTGAGLAAVEFASYLESGVVERGELTGFLTLFRRDLPEAECISLRSVDTDPDALARARQAVANAGTLVLATRSAHIIPEQLAMARELMSLARRVVLVCLRNPYDAEALTGAAAVLCTCGDSAPSLQAAVDALMGRYVPEGRLPVAWEQAV
ncbi:MAG: beta-N-acetylhexosaminidase [Chloroflexi bacterium]|nr:beta-N-acetylhexosaminidase [Chloroflexota bacterium]